MILSLGQLPMMMLSARQTGILIMQQDPFNSSIVRFLFRYIFRYYCRHDLAVRQLDHSSG